MKTPLLFLLCAALPARAEVASFYGEEHRGKITASGARFNPDNLTAASWRFPLGARVMVSAGGRSVLVVINDRGPSKKLHRDIDLSRAAFEKIAPLSAGLVTVSIRGIP